MAAIVDTEPARDRCDHLRVVRQPSADDGIGQFAAAPLSLGQDGQSDEVRRTAGADEEMSGGNVPSCASATVRPSATVTCTPRAMSCAPIRASKPATSTYGRPCTTVHACSAGVVLSACCRPCPRTNAMSFPNSKNPFTRRAAGFRSWTSGAQVRRAVDRPGQRLVPGRADVQLGSMPQRRSLPAAADMPA